MTTISIFTGLLFMGILFTLIFSDIDEDLIGFVMFLVLVLLVSSSMLGSFATEKYSYKKGQVDALTNKIKYELKLNADSTKTWELIDSLKTK